MKTEEFDYYGNLIKYEVEGDVDGIIINIISTSIPIEDTDEETDIKFHCKMDYIDREQP